MSDLIPIRRALLSVSDKTDLVPFARALAARNVTIISTGGTAEALKEAGVEVVSIDQLTGFPEIMGGRVKSLHPKVHGGLLAVRNDAEHQAAMETHEIEPIDLICVNLYPFERTIAKSGVDRSEAIEQIDIGGPAMLRSGAKNHEFVTVVTSPRQYDRVINELQQHDGSTSAALRADLAAAAFSRTADYDATIAAWLHRRQGEAFPDQLRLNMTKSMDLRYGENPHQRAAVYRDPASRGPSVVNAELVAGKPLSYNNLNDAAAALALVLDIDAPAAAIIKHTNPCGCGTAESLADATARALTGDPMAAYGGIVAVNRTVDAATAECIARKSNFFEVVVAPNFEDDALQILRHRWEGVRLMAVGEGDLSTSGRIEYRSVPGGMLVQTRDLSRDVTSEWQHAAGPEPTGAMLCDAALIWMVTKHLKSNAVAVGGDGQLYGAGAGQMDRVTASRLAVEKAGSRANGAVAASDAFFPFPDGPAILADAGIKLIVQPGGSKRDQETFDLCDERGITCMMTGVRHFKH